MQGKMKIKGNMQAAMKFTPDVFPKGSLWSSKPLAHLIIASYHPIIFWIVNIALLMEKDGIYLI
jgi:hypothetical protein